MASKKFPYCIEPGRLRQRVNIETPTTPTNGEVAPTFSNLATGVPAEVIETSGGEYVRGRQVEAGISAVVTIRYRSDVTPNMRLKYGTRYLNIVAARDRTGYRSELTIDCKEVQP